MAGERGGAGDYQQICNILLTETCRTEDSLLRAVRWVVEVWGCRAQKSGSEGFEVDGTNA